MTKSQANQKPTSQLWLQSTFLQPYLLMYHGSSSDKIIIVIHTVKFNQQHEYYHPIAIKEVKISTTRK